MDPAFWVAITAVFVSGGAIGTVGTLMAQWVVRRIDGQAPPARSFETAEMEVLRQEVSEMNRRIRNVDARLEFQEELLGGASPKSVPPPRLEDPEEVEAPVEGDPEAS